MKCRRFSSSSTSSVLVPSSTEPLRGDGAGGEEQGVGKAGLARRPMSSQGDVPDVGDVIRRGHGRIELRWYGGWVSCACDRVAGDGRELAAAVEMASASGESPFVEGPADDAARDRAGSPGAPGPPGEPTPPEAITGVFEAARPGLRSLQVRAPRACRRARCRCR